MTEDAHATHDADPEPDPATDAPPSDRADDSTAGDRSDVTRLDEATVARIAAGEVATRPAAVVRELIENALDAGAGVVRVAVSGAGLEEIRVTDDGRGMGREDAALAVERHTTSKIGTPEDLERAATLGFRGEALPSIAEMARLELTTRPEEADAGTRVVVADGEKRVERAGHGVGTTVVVRDLFSDVPARRESLASPSREFARVSDAVTGYALAHPDVRFRLSHDGRQVLSAPGTGDPTDALLAAYDRRVAGQSTTVEHEADGVSVRVRGIVAYPAVTRASREHVHAAVNGRPLADADLRAAVEAGYGSLLPGDRHPVAAVQVSVPPERVDQNVHPAKREVRFTDPDAVAGAVEAAVRAALGDEDLSRRAEAEFDLADPGSALSPAESRFDELNVIGQFRGLYVLCESDDDLLVVDQHAAHERINYERLRTAVDGDPESVAVDPPATLSLSPAAEATLEDRRAAIETMGFRVEPFGGGTYRVTAVPAPFGRAADPEDVRDVVDAFLAGDGVEDPREALLADLACHPSLKAGDDLSTAEAEELLDRLGACERPYACPHGRPTVLSIEEATLAKGFGRSATRMD